MPSFYDGDPAAFEEAVDRNQFTGRLLEGTRLADFMASDPEDHAQATAKGDLNLVLERAWQEHRRARADAFASGGWLQ